jgi:hypothetical protein
VSHALYQVLKQLAPPDCQGGGVGAALGKLHGLPARRLTA